MNPHNMKPRQPCLLTVAVWLVLTQITPPVLAQSFLTKGLIAYYPANGNANDATGNGNNGEVQGAQLVPDRFGNPNTAYSFSGINSLILLTNSFLLPGDWTISAWARPNTLNQEGFILHIGADDGITANGFGIDFNHGELFGLLSSILKWDSGLAVTNTNSWVQVVMQRTGTLATVFLNGSAGPFTRNGTPPNPIQGFIGSESKTTLLFDGLVDDVRIYNRALSTHEVEQLYVYESQTHIDGTFQIVYGQYSWPEAKSDAESRGGHLATFLNQTEWNLAQPQISQFNSQVVQDLWIGGYQPAGSPEPAGNWTWITGEPWTFSFWLPGEPNNQGGIEDSLMVGGGGTGWNDASSATRISYLLEYGPRVDLIKAVKPSFPNLSLGINYQLQVSTDMNTWTNEGVVFTATNSSMVYPQYFDVPNWNQLFFRLQFSP